MAEFRDVAKAYKRLCDAFKTCEGCPLDDLVRTAPNCETGVFRRYPEEAERIIMDWAAEHPIKTNGVKFREVFGVDCTEPILCDFDGWLEQEYKEGQNETD